MLFYIRNFFFFRVKMSSKKIIRDEIIRDDLERDIKSESQQAVFKEPLTA